ncbi:hypothetical protein MICABA_02353 [Microbacterium sp. T2.11-28]|nr:hypothetical protein MICABA_02353 [Microbacterium sp. T2.11-28]
MRGRRDHAGTMRGADEGELRAALRTTEHLIARGWTPRGIRAACESGGLHRVRRGAYIAGELWTQLWGESRHLAHVLAVDAAARAPGATVFGLSSALVLHGIPLACPAPRRVHVIVGEGDRRSAPDVFRHEGALALGEVVSVAGVLCTSIERTVYDLARLASPEVALVAANAALAREGGDPRDFDHERAERLRRALAARVDAAGVRGIRQARDIVAVADGRAQSTLESLSLLQIVRLGFERPPLQVRIPGASPGSAYWVDIELPGARAFYECDGEAKYTDPALLGGRTPEQAVREEKRREDWIRGVTGYRVVRGGMRDVRTPEALAVRLSAFGIPLPRRAHRLLPSRPLLAGL